MTEPLDDSPEQRAYEASEVRLLLSKEIVKEAWAATERRILEEWKRAPTVPERENCWAKFKVFEAFKQELHALSQRPHLQILKE